MPYTRSVIPPSLIAAGGVIYAGSGSVYALDAATGALLHRYERHASLGCTVAAGMLLAYSHAEGG